MNNQDKKIIERLENEFYQIASNVASQQENIEREDIENMKDLQKICYYMEVRCAMKEGAEDEYMDDADYDERSYRGRSYNGNGGSGGNSYNRGNSYARGGYGRSSGRRSSSYMNGGRSGRGGNRYYDNEVEKENSMNDLRQMLQMEQDPEKRSMLEGIMRVMEEK